MAVINQLEYINRIIELNDTIDNNINATYKLRTKLSSVVSSINRIESKLRYPTNKNSHSSSKQNTSLLERVKKHYSNEFVKPIQDKMFNSATDLLDSLYIKLSDGVGKYFNFGNISSVLSSVYPWAVIANIGIDIAKAIGSKIIEVGNKVWNEKLQPSLPLDELEMYIKKSAGSEKGSRIVEAINNTILNSSIDPTNAFQVGDILASTLSKTEYAGKSTNQAFSIIEKLSYSNKTKDYVGISEAVDSALKGNFTELTKQYKVDMGNIDTKNLTTVEQRLNAINKVLSTMGFDEGYVNDFRNLASNKSRTVQNKRDYRKIQMTGEKRQAINDSLDSWMSIYDSYEYMNYINKLNEKDISDYTRGKKLEQWTLKTKIARYQFYDSSNEMDPFGYNDLSSDLNPSSYAYQSTEKKQEIVMNVTFKDTVIKEEADMGLFIDNYVRRLATVTANSPYIEEAI